MRNTTRAIVFTAILSTFPTALFAADPMAGMPMGTAPMAAMQTYRFELASPIEAKDGKSIVSIRLVHVADKKPVTGALIIQSRADMGPIGMAAMTAPIKALPATVPGVYPFEIANGGVWNKSAKWALTFAAKVQGEAATVRGSVIVELTP
ncbi:MAG: FixH family protein [Alphaproteobacteria bacterium]|nr:FixH family protein [Alphaproteobacteria bacterium]MBL7100199.1 FixH family protein [Alphaproteobacteria bacterium]